MRTKKKQVAEGITFLGTGGARYVIAKQLRATGGILFRLDNKNILVDPGPESLSRFLAYVPDLAPEKLDAVILSHKHIDHAADINVYLDILTRGGFKKNGYLMAPQDAFGQDGVIFKYILKYLDKVDIIKPGFEVQMGNFTIACPIQHIHPVETYGLRFVAPNFSISYISDTKFFPEIIDVYKADILILNLLRLERSEIEHLAVPDGVDIINGIKPKVALITHFGMTILRAGPWNIARKLQKATGVTVLAVEDGKHYTIDRLLSYK